MPTFHRGAGKGAVQYAARRTGSHSFCTRILSEHDKQHKQALNFRESKSTDYAKATQRTPRSGLAPVR